MEIPNQINEKREGACIAPSLFCSLLIKIHYGREFYPLLSTPFLSYN
jgi:hypothetical protein